MSTQRALFLDRDGVINREIGDYVTHQDLFFMNEDIYPIVKRANEKGWKVIVITNQGGIGKGLYTHETLQLIHQKMKDAFAIQNCVIDDILYCPHHPDFTGNCICRKPDSLLLEKAIHIHKIDIAHSVFIGDNIRDMEAAKKVNLKGLLIPSNQLDHLPSLEY